MAALDDSLGAMCWWGLRVINRVVPVLLMGGLMLGGAV